MRPAPEKIEITGYVQFKTAKALLFYDGVKEAWLPVSQVEIVEEKDDAVTVLAVPEWLAVEKGFI